MNQSSQKHLLHLPPRCEDRGAHKYISEKKSFCTVQRCVITPPTFVISDPHHTDPHRLPPPTSDLRRPTPDGCMMTLPTTASHRMAPDHRPTADSYRVVPDPHRPLSDPHWVTPPNSNPHDVTARFVPELNSLGAEFIGADADTGGISCLPHGFLDTLPDPSHHPTTRVNLPVQKDEYSRLEEEELARSQSQEFLAECSDLQQTTRASLYDFEDVLRHRINVHIEDFRLGLQHTLTGEFSDFSSAVQAQQQQQQQQRPAKCGRYDGDGCVHMVMGGGGGGGSVGSLESYGQEASVEGSHRVIGDDHTSVDVDSGLSSVDRGMESSAVDRGVDSGNLHRGEHCRTNSDVHILDRVDPVLSESSKASVTLDQLINHQLIELQTCASLITSILRRPEYAHVP